MNPQDFLLKISAIVGQDISGGQITMHLSWADRVEGRALLIRLRTMQKQLRLLKRDVGAVISAVKSQFITARTGVGKTIGSGLAGAFFGRRTIGRINAARRDDLRRGQITAVAPYEEVKRIIDQILYQLDTVKGQIEISPQYLDADSRRGPSIKSESETANNAAPTASRFYVYVSEQVKGPYSVEQLQALRDASAILDNTPCCPEGSEKWSAYVDTNIQ